MFYNDIIMSFIDFSHFMKLLNRFSDHELQLLKLKLSFYCVYQSAINDLLSEFADDNDLTDDEVEELSIMLRKDIDRKIVKFESD